MTSGRTLIEIIAAFEIRLIQFVVHALQECQVACRTRAYLIQNSLDVVDIMGQQLYQTSLSEHLFRFSLLNLRNYPEELCVYLNSFLSIQVNGEQEPA